MKINFPQSMDKRDRYVLPALMLISITAMLTTPYWWPVPTNTLPIIISYLWYGCVTAALAFMYYMTWKQCRRLDESNARLQRIAERYKK